MKKIKYTIKDKEIFIKISKRSKKNVILRLHKDEVSVSIPKNSTYKFAMEIIKEKEEWILDKLYKIDKEISQKFDDTKLMFLGKIYKIIEEKNINGVYIDRGYLRINRYDIDVLRDWLKGEALKIFSERYNFFADVIGLNAFKIRIRYMKSAWGICYGNKSITYNLLLIHAPLYVIDYVIIHELCHLKHMNHSKEFWTMVKNFCPEFKEAKLWLKENGQGLYKNPLFV